jgi:hypothetical protein
MRRSIGLMALATTMLLRIAVPTVPAQAQVPGPNGQILFGKFKPPRRRARHSRDGLLAASFVAPVVDDFRGALPSDVGRTDGLADDIRG